MSQDNGRDIYGHGVVATSLKCRQCRYELRGLNASKLCPECGLSIWASVQHAADPEGARLPQIRNPKVVGGSLFWIVVVSLSASILWEIRPVLLLMDRIAPSGSEWFSRFTPPMPRLIASVLVLSAIWPIWRLLPPRGAKEIGAVRRDLRLLLLGFFFAGLSMLELAFFHRLQHRLPVTWVPYYDLAIKLSLVFFLVIVLMALQGVLRVVGQRSRQYRTARDSRQNVHVLLAVLVFVAIGLILQKMPAGTWPSDGFWSSLSMVMVAISYVVFVIGLASLLYSVWGIRRVLRQRPPTIDELLLPPPRAIPTDVRLPDFDTTADNAETAQRENEARSAATGRVDPDTGNPRA